MKHAIEESEKNAMRLLECTKACADIPNPSAIPEVVEALRKMIGIFESEIHNEYDGTSMLDERLAEADFARTALDKLEQGGEG